MERENTLKRFLYRTATQKHLNYIEFILFSILSLLIYLNNLSEIDFQPDETFWIVTSVRLDEFVRGNFSARIWDESFDAFEVRPIPSYIVAISQRLAGINPEDLPAKYWDWSASRRENILNGALPGDRVLFYSRFPIAILAASSMLIMTAFIAHAHSRIAAYIFFVSSFNTYFLVHLRRAMSETPLLLFSILAMISTYKLLNEIQRKNAFKILVWSIVIGVLSGLAGQSKLTGLACGFSAIIASLLKIYKQKLLLQRADARLFRLIFWVIPITMMIVFVCSYPFFFHKTVLRVVASFLMRNYVLQDQLKHYSSDVILPDQRLSIVLKNVFFYPIHVGNENNFIIPLLNLSIASYGIYFIVKGIIRESEGIDFYSVLITTSTVCAIPMLFTPLDWDRYYLFPIFFTCVFFSIGLTQIGVQLFKKQVIPSNNLI
jgi:hypothetical protein